MAEALLPPRLFTNRVFVVCALLGLVSGAVMFGTTVYLQWYFQVVAGLSPTRSGLQVLPFLAGILFAPSCPAGYWAITAATSGWCWPDQSPPPSDSRY